MDKIKTFFRTLYHNTFRDSAFRKLTLSTRLKAYILLSILIAFFANLYIYGSYKELTFIFFMVTSTVFSYFLFLILNMIKSNSYKHLKLHYLITYLFVEIIIVSLIIIRIYFYIKSIVM